MREPTQTVDSAKQFLLSRLIEQAQHERVPLSEVEKQMFLFSETSVSGSNPKAAEKFDAECNRDDYEAKITKLLRRAYSRDKRTPDGKQPWKESLSALRDEDFYGLVMVDQAGIPRPEPHLGAFGLQFVLFTVIELAIIAIGSLVVFQPSRLRLAIPDWLRLLSMPMFIGLIWLVGEVFGFMEWAKFRKRAASKEI